MWVRLVPGPRIKLSKDEPMDKVTLQISEHFVELYSEYLQWRDSQNAKDVATERFPSFEEFMAWLDRRVKAAHAA